jgi:hypothetical protein
MFIEIFNFLFIRLTYLIKNGYLSLRNAQGHILMFLADSVYNTVEPRFTNLIRSWRPFVTRNVRKPKLFYIILLYIYKNTTQWNSREGKANSSRDVHWAKVIQQLTLSRRYSQLVANRCCRLAWSLLETPFVTRNVFCSENLFVNRFVRDERHSLTEVPLYLVNKQHELNPYYLTHHIKNEPLKSMPNFFQVSVIFPTTLESSVCELLKFLYFLCKVSLLCSDEMIK